MVCLGDYLYCSMTFTGWADTPAVRNSMPDFHRKMKNRLRTTEQGADTIIWLCVARDVDKFPSGSFFQDRQAVSKHLPLAWTKASSHDKETLMTELDKLASKFKE